MFLKISIFSPRFTSLGQDGTAKFKVVVESTQPDYLTRQTTLNRDESYGPGVFDNLVPLMNLLYPSTIVGGIGLLTMAFYVKQVDDAYNRTLSKFQKVHNNTDYR